MRRAWPAVVILLAGCATFRTLFLGDRPPFIPPEAARLSGPYSRAAGVAFEDWMADRAQQKVERDAYEDAGNIVHPENRRVAECFDRPEAYQTWIWPNDAGTSYIVY